MLTMADTIRRKSINMIAILIILIAMTAGLFSPAACDDFYNKLIGLNNRTSEVHAISERAQRECVLDESSSHHSATYQLQRNADGSLTGIALSDEGPDTFGLTSSSHRLAGYLTAASSRLICRSSIFFSSYIHLKDGQK